MQSNKITFKAQNDHVFNVRMKPVPAAQYTPDWWKSIPKYSNDKNKLELSPASSVTVKQCAPMFDSLTSGYIIPLWTDILVSQINGYPKIQWNSSAETIDYWSPQQSNGVEIPDGFSSSVFKYYHGWTIKTPKGWSCFFTHPIGYQNSPIKSLSGIVDTDILDGEINCPFVIKDGFEGIIEKGTPMVQIIPIKRSSWKAEYEEMDKLEHYFNAERIRTKLYGYYRSIREKKIYR